MHALPQGNEMICDQVLCPAKINLFLDIHSIRENGYHNIISFMQGISLHDSVTVSFLPSEKKTISVFCDKIEIPSDRSNLAYKAADIFPCCGDISVKIEKKIPVSAGLAGGSADCAATLVALNKLCDEKLSLEELCTLGAKLGADVPFCIKGGACLVEGIGEVLTPISSMPHFPIVVAKKGEGMSTPYAYGALDSRLDRFTNYKPKTKMLDILLNAKQGIGADEFCKGVFNVFESVVEPERPLVTEIKNTMISCGAAAALMSGSGTSVFGIFEMEDDARAAVNKLKAEGADAYLCYPQ